MSSTFTWSASANRLIVKQGTNVIFDGDVSGIGPDHQASLPVVYEAAQAMAAGTASGTITISNA